MAQMKTKHIYLVFFTTLSLAYFIAISSLEINDFWKSEMILILLQLLGISYFTYGRWNRL